METECISFMRKEFFKIDILNLFHLIIIYVTMAGRDTQISALLTEIRVVGQSWLELKLKTDAM